MLGTFYCAPEPGAAPFVRVGDDVAEGATIGLLEAMKMFTAVPAGVDGTIESIVVSDGDLVEYDQPIALIRTR
jgi:acetyl-CoA carboxylase biotin carboxyl carrier protein